MRIRITLAAVVLMALASSAFGETIWHSSGILSPTAPGPPAPPSPGLGTVTLKFNSYLNNTSPINMWVQNQTSSGVRYDVLWPSQGGSSQFTKVSGTGAIGGSIRIPNGALNGFSVELEQPAYPGTMTFAVNPLSSSPNGAPQRQALLDELWGRYYSSVFTGSLADQRNKAEAFSLAVLELRYETGSPVDVTAGPGFRASNDPWRNMPTITGMANNWLRSLDGTGPMWDVWELDPTWPNGGNYFQDMLVGAPTAPVPEPSTPVYLIALGLALGCGTWWKTRRAAAGK